VNNLNWVKLTRYSFGDWLFKRAVKIQTKWWL